MFIILGYFGFRVVLGEDYDYWLVVSTPLKNMKVSWDDDIPHHHGKIKVMFQSPPTRYLIYIDVHFLWKFIRFDHV